MNDNTKNEATGTILQRMRAFVPERALEYHEARVMAERQAMLLLLGVLDQYEPPVDIGLIGELPRVRVQVVPNAAISGLIRADPLGSNQGPLAHRDKSG